MEKHKILLVDDSIVNLEFMFSVFEKHKPTYEVIKASNPINAITISNQITPDLIITDWNMPEFSGVELIKKIKNEPTLKDIPIIMTTGVMITAENLQTALDAGAIDYIRKPIEPVELIARTSSALLITSYYKEIIEQKNKDIAESSLHLIKGQEFNRMLSSKIDSLKRTTLSDPYKAVDDMSIIKDELSQIIDEDSWYRFNISFSNVHANFNKNLTHKHNNLTPAELKLCAFIRLGMANKEIASILNQSTDSIKTSRYRLRKKLKIDNINLETYIAMF